MRLLILLLLGLWPGSSGAAQTSWCSYHLRTLQSALDTAEVHLPARQAGSHKGTIWRDPQQYVKLYVTYTGRHRPLGPVADAYLRTIARDTSDIDHFSQEILVVDNSLSAWLVIANVIDTALREEAQPGDSVWLFATIHGLSGGPSPFWVVVVNEFGTADSTAAWSGILRQCQGQ